MHAWVCRAMDTSIYISKVLMQYCMRNFQYSVCNENCVPHNHGRRNKAKSSPVENAHIICGL